MRGTRTIATAACAALVVASMAGGLTASTSFPRPDPDGRHGAAPAPGPGPAQDWGPGNGPAGAGGRDAAAAGHPAGGPGNRTVPASLRSRYPLRPESAVPAVPPNPAEVGEPARHPGRGYDPATSVELPATREEYQRTYVNADGTHTTEFSTHPAVRPRTDPPVDSGVADSGAVMHGDTWRSGSADLLVGNQGGAVATSYVKFPGLADRLRFHTVFGAQLQVANYDSASCRARPVGVHPVTQAWSPGESRSSAPAVGAALTSSSFAYGHIAVGQSRSACPASAALFNLGSAGRDVVQGWADGGTNHGLALRADGGDPQAWKRFAGTGTANAPRLFVTHSPYNARYAIPNPVPNPPVLQNQAGRVTVAVTNLSAEQWTPSTYYLAYRAYHAVTGAAVGQRRAGSLPGTVARGARVSLEATIQPLPPGRYFLDFTMVRTGGIVFTDEQVPPARLVLQVFDIPPVVQELYPPNGYQAPTLTPQLWARAVDIDAPPGSALRFGFRVCEGDGSGAGTNCLDSGFQAGQAWTVPAGRLAWSKTYQWRVVVRDGGNEVTSPWSVVLSAVPQPEITSRLAGAPTVSREREFDAQTGNVSTAAVDAAVATVGPDLSVVRTYNSLDPRRDLAFGAGWVTRFDMRVVPDDDGSGNVVVTYPDGQQVRYGRNPDGTFAAPSGRVATLAVSGTTWTLADRAGARYQFDGTGRLTRITDASGRALVLTYGTDGRLAQASTAVSQGGTGRSLWFTWSGTHVTTVRTDPVDGAALTWSYSYDGDRLTRVCATGDACTTYTYAAASHYRGAVLDSRPESYYRLGEPTGTGTGTAAGSEVAVNLGKDAAAYRNVTLGVPGALPGADNTAATFNGSSSVLTLPKGAVKKSRDLAVEVWFKVSPAQTGGPLVGYQDQPIDGSPTAGVPVLYVGTDGRLRGTFATGAVNAGTVAPITSAAAVNNDRWHHAVLSAMGSTQTLYLDGVLVGTQTATIDHAALTFNQAGAAHAASPASWPAWGTAARRFFAGSLDEVAVYTRPLGATAVAAHHRFGTQAADQLARITLPSGKTAAVARYDVATGRVAEFTDHNGGTWRIGPPAVFGGDRDLRRSVQVLDPAGRPYLYEYDALTALMLRSGAPMGLGVREEDRPGQPSPGPSPGPSPPSETCTQPDPTDPQFCTVIPGNAGGPVFVRHPIDGMAIRSFSYDDRGFPTVITDGNGDTVTLGYDARGNVTSRRTCRSASQCHTAFYTFPTGLSVLDPRADLPTEVRDARSAGATDNTYRTVYTYTAAGALATQTNADGGTVRHTYTNGSEPAVGGGATPPGLPLTSTDPRGGVTRHGYRANGDLATATEPSGLSTVYVHDALGRLRSQTRTSDTYPAGLTTTYTYDAASRPLSTLEPVTTDSVSGAATGVRHQRRTTHTYDVDGNVTRTEVADALGGDPARITTTVYDEHNRPARVTDAEGHETGYGYDRFGNRTFVVDPEGNRTEYAYTARNAVAEVRLRDWTGDPPGVPSPGEYLVLDSYAYDPGGRMVRHTDAMGRTVEYTYNGDSTLARATLKAFRNPDGSTRDYVMQANTYDGASNLIRQVAGNGTAVTEHTITRVGQVASTTDDPTGLARRTTYTYDPAGSVTSVTTSGNAANVPWAVPVTSETVSYTYGTDGTLRTETAGSGASLSVTGYRYDQRGLVVARTDPRGMVAGADAAAYTTTYTNDELGRPVSARGGSVNAEQAGGAAQPVNPTRTTGYNTFDEAVAIRDEVGNVVRYGYDRLGRVVTTTSPAYAPPGSMSIFTPTMRSSYDGLGNVVERIDPRGNAIRYSYDRLGRLTARDEPGATNDQRAVWRFTHTRTGEVLSTTDPLGARTEATYDDLDRQVTATVRERYPTAGAFTTRYRYDDAGNPLTVTSPTGAVITMTYDPVGEVTRRVDPFGVPTHFGYDFAGREVRRTDGAGRTRRTDYDALGRTVADADLSPTAAVLRTQRYSYDPDGNLLSTVDPLDHVTTFDHDAGGRLTRQVEPGPITTAFGYDAAGNRTRYTDGRGNVTTYTVNSLGLPESVLEPATAAHPNAADRTWTVSYDAAGNAVRLAAPGGVVRQRTFDAAGRPTGETGTGAEAATGERQLRYDLAGRLASVSVPGGTNTYTHDDRGNELTAGGPSGAATFTYDADGNLTARTDAAGTSRFTYDRGRLATTTDAASGTTQRLGYNGAGEVSTVDFGSGRVRTYTYDALGRPATDTLRNAAGTTVAAIGYGYDVDDRLVRKTTAGTAGAADNTYGYDPAGRLTSWTAAGRTVSYGWDAAGNRISAEGRTASYDARNRLIAAGGETYTHTPRGTLATHTASGQTRRYSFDAFDRLVESAGQSYAYDGLDRLASRNGTAFGYAGSSDEMVSTGTERYGRGPDGELLGVARGQTARVALTDQHDDVVAGFDAADPTLGALADSTAYDPFGAVTARGGTGSAAGHPALGYQGDWTDPTTGEVDMGARWYAPATGSFTARDSVTYTAGDSILANRYAYAAGDPLANVDPDGNWPTCGWCGKVGGAVGAVGGAVRAVGGVVKGVVKKIANSPVGRTVIGWGRSVLRGTLSIGKSFLSAVKRGLDLSGSLLKRIYEGGKRILSGIGGFLGNARNFLSGGGLGDWLRAKKEQLRRDARQFARNITRKALAAVRERLRVDRLPFSPTALKPIYATVKMIVSAAPHLRAGTVAVLRDVVRDARRGADGIYQKLVRAVGTVVETVTRAAAAPEVDSPLGQEVDTVEEALLITADAIAEAVGAKFPTCTATVPILDRLCDGSQRWLSTSLRAQVRSYCRENRVLCNMRDPDYVTVGGGLALPRTPFSVDGSLTVMRTGQVYAGAGGSAALSLKDAKASATFAVGWIHDRPGRRAPDDVVAGFADGFATTGRGAYAYPRVVGLTASGGNLSVEHGVSSDVAEFGASYGKQFHDFGGLWN